MVKIKIIDSKDKVVDLVFDRKAQRVYYGQILLNGNKVGNFELDTKKMIKHGFLNPINISESEFTVDNAEPVTKQDLDYIKGKFIEDGGRVLTAIIDFLKLTQKDIPNLYGFLKKYSSLLNIYLNETTFSATKFSDGTQIIAKFIGNSFLCEMYLGDLLLLKVPKTSYYSEKYTMSFSNGSESRCLEGSNFFVYFLKNKDELKVFYYRYKKDFQVKIIDLASKETKVIHHSNKLRELPMKMAFDAIDLFRAMKVHEVGDKKFLGFTVKDLTELYPNAYNTQQAYADRLVKDLYLRIYKKNALAIYYVEPDEWTCQNYGFTREV